MSDALSTTQAGNTAPVEPRGSAPARVFVATPELARMLSVSERKLYDLRRQHAPALDPDYSSGETGRRLSLWHVRHLDYIASVLMGTSTPDAAAAAWAREKALIGVSFLPSLVERRLQKRAEANA